MTEIVRIIGAITGEGSKGADGDAARALGERRMFPLPAGTAPRADRGRTRTGEIGRAQHRPSIDTPTVAAMVAP